MLIACFFSTGAVRNNQCFTSATDSEINSHTIRWFNLASDRSGGRKEHARAKEALTEVSFRRCTVAGCV